MQDEPSKTNSPPPVPPPALPAPPQTIAVPVEVLPPESPIPQGEEPQPLPRPRLSRKRLALAFTIAALADVLSVFLTFTPPVEWAADLVTAILLFMVLGWQWILLPGLIMEAIPGLYVFPFWVLVVGAVAMWGTARPQLNNPPTSGTAGGRK
jgi:hypothetical protein